MAEEVQLDQLTSAVDAGVTRMNMESSETTLKKEDSYIDIPSSVLNNAQSKPSANGSTLTNLCCMALLVLIILFFLLLFLIIIFGVSIAQAWS